MKTKASHNKYKMDDVHGYLQSINQGVGTHKNKKKSIRNYRKEKHKKNTRDFL